MQYYRTPVFYSKKIQMKELSTRTGPEVRGNLLEFPLGRFALETVWSTSVESHGRVESSTLRIHLTRLNGPKGGDGFLTATQPSGLVRLEARSVPPPKLVVDSSGDIRKVSQFRAHVLTNWFS